jgi:HlyD family secretion protein
LDRLRLLRNPRVLGAAALVGVLLAVALWPSPRPVDLGKVERGALRVTVDDEGETRVRHRFVVSAPVAGRLQRVVLEPGDAVRTGQVVAALLPADPVPLDARSRAEAMAAAEAARAALGQARAELERARAAAALASSELQRNRDLAATGVVSAQVLDAREAEARSSAEALRAAEFGVAAAEQQLVAARARLGESIGVRGAAIELRSPIDGVVFKRLRESESVVPAGDPVLELGDPGSLEIVSDLLSSDAVKVAPGAPVIVEQWGGERTLRGKVRRVEPSGFMKVSALGVEEQRVNVVVDFEDPREAWKALGDGYRVEVRIVVWEGADVLKAPLGALFRRGDAWSTFVAEGGRARQREIEIGHRNGMQAEVVKGLSAGDTVVVHPPDGLADGARIAERK